MSNFWEAGGQSTKERALLALVVFSAFECVCSVYLFQGNGGAITFIYYRFTVATAVIFADLFALFLLTLF